MNHYERVCANINLDAVKYNLAAMKANIAEHTKIIGVIKTDGYGHGAVPIAWELEKLDYVFGYAVATMEEAMQLRNEQLHKPILILGQTFPYAYDGMIQEQIRPAVFQSDIIKELGKRAQSLNMTCKVHIKVDTGMSRIGIRPDEYGKKIVAEAIHTKGIEVEGIFTHFARADESDKSSANKQMQDFLNFVRECEKENHFSFPMVHCSNSAGIVEMKEANMDLVRAGITLYGLWPSEEVNQSIISLQPVLSLVSHVAYIKELPEGTPVSYGATFVTTRKTKVATIPVGYGDGYPRTLSNKASVLIHGKRAAILGRICMDQFMVDVTDIPDVAEGDLVTLIGTDKTECITMEELGELSGRFNYELACDLGKRIPRVFYKNEKAVYCKDYFTDVAIQKINN